MTGKFPAPFKPPPVFHQRPPGHPPPWQHPKMPPPFKPPPVFHHRPPGHPPPWQHPKMPPPFKPPPLHHRPWEHAKVPIHAKPPVHHHHHRPPWQPPPAHHHRPWDHAKVPIHAKPPVVHHRPPWQQPPLHHRPPAWTSAKFPVHARPYTPPPLHHRPPPSSAKFPIHTRPYTPPPLHHSPGAGPKDPVPGQSLPPYRPPLLARIPQPIPMAAHRYPPVVYGGMPGPGSLLRNAIGIGTVALTADSMLHGFRESGQQQQWFVDAWARHGGRPELAGPAYDRWGHCFIAGRTTERTVGPVAVAGGIAYETIHELGHLFGVVEHDSMFSDLHAQWVGTRLAQHGRDFRMDCLRATLGQSVDGHGSLAGAPSGVPDPPPRPGAMLLLNLATWSRRF